VIAGWGLGILHGLSKTVGTLAEDVRDLRNHVRDIRATVAAINEQMPQRDDEGSAQHEKWPTPWGPASERV